MLPSILSIQSHVAFGYVGNRAAVPPLQALGFDVSAIHTVQFSNHTGYGAWQGQVFDAGHIASLVTGIADRGVLSGFSGFLTGYMGDVAIGHVLHDTAISLRAANPDLVYCCDPVMGDVGRGFFAAPAIPPFFRDHLLAKADIITPNQFELEFLAGGVAITDFASAIQAAHRVQQNMRPAGPGWVLVTSLQRRDAAVGTIEMLLVTRDAAYCVATPFLPFDVAPNGSGDVTASLFLGHYVQKKGDAPLCLAATAGGIFHVMERTHSAQTRELQLVASLPALMRGEFTHFPVTVMKKSDYLSI